MLNIKLNTVILAIIELDLNKIMEQLITEIKKDIAIVQLNNGKVNAISHQLVKSLHKCFIALGKDDNIKGVLLTGHTGAFSAGLDVVEQSNFNEEEARAFWVDYFGAIQAMVRYPRPLVCAITGFAPAGGTILTLCADYRVMAEEEKHVIGMHEFKLSMQIPELMMDLWCYTLGEQKAFQDLQNAKLYSAKEALSENIVQEIAPASEVFDKAMNHLKKCVAVYTPVYVESKRLARKELLALVDRNIEELASDFVTFGKDPELKKRIQLFAKQLKHKK